VDKGIGHHFYGTMGLPGNSGQTLPNRHLSSLFLTMLVLAMIWPFVFGSLLHEESKSFSKTCEKRHFSDNLVSP